MGAPIRYVKGHGTGNDFVILPDPEGLLDLSEDDVRVICDRRFGIGADGILRLVPTDEVEGLWFMDYRNADGSLAEMCGNGARVFARYLVEAGLETGPDLEFMTRAGRVRARILDDSDEPWQVTVEIGVPQSPQLNEAPVVSLNGDSWPATALNLPNPHAIVWVTDLADAGDLSTAPSIEPDSIFPEGANVEFVVAHPAGDGGEPRVAMRVHERGSGETLSCGTGAAAVGVAALRLSTGRPLSWPEAPAATSDPVPGTVRVTVAGGEVLVTERPDGVVELTGPAMIVAKGELEPEAFNQSIPRQPA